VQARGILAIVRAGKVEGGRIDHAPL
jgi:hypothetical protein